jgi:hypothetical protein
VQLPISAGDSSPPVWTDTVGVSKLIPSNEQITVEFGAATDEQSPPVSYRVYWAPGDPEQPGAPFDYDTASFADVAAGPYFISGLTNGQYYRVAVRASDSALPPNRETNPVLLGVVAGATDIYPPEWQGTAGLTELFYGQGKALLAWGQAIDSHTDEFGTWESGPVIYRVYHGEGQTPKLDGALFKDYTDVGQIGNVAVLDGLDTTKPHWFILRARDQATLPNEDFNEIVQTTPGVLVELKPMPPPSIPFSEETMLVSYEYIYNADYSQVALMRYMRNNNGPRDMVADYMPLDAEGRLQLAASYELGDSLNWAAALDADNELVLAYAQRTATFSTGDLYIERNGGKQYYDIGNVGTSELGVSASGNVFSLALR